MVCETSCHDSLHILEFITDITNNDPPQCGTKHCRLKPAWVGNEGGSVGRGSEHSISGQVVVVVYVVVVQRPC